MKIFNNTETTKLLCMLFILAVASKTHAAAGGEDPADDDRHPKFAWPEEAGAVYRPGSANSMFSEHDSTEGRLRAEEAIFNKERCLKDKPPLPGMIDSEKSTEEDTDFTVGTLRKVPTKYELDEYYNSPTWKAVF